MRRFLGWMSVCLLTPVLCAQTVIYSADKNAPTASTSDASIDLLKSSFAQSDVSGVYTGVQIDKSSSSATPEKKKIEEKEAEESAASEPVGQGLDFISLGMFPAGKLDTSLNPQTLGTSPLSGQPTIVEQDIEYNNALIDRPQKINYPTTMQDKQAREELDYAARRLVQSENQKKSRPLPQAASKQPAVPAVKNSGNRPFNPNDYRPAVKWKRADSTHFVIYNQQRDNGIGSANMNMIFESAYETLRRNIPWMISGKVRVFVYQDHSNYLRHEPNAKGWTRALAYPTRGEIVVYDEPGKQQELKEVFTHELVHVFTQQFFDKHKTGELMTPVWLDEGLAVYMEDQAYNGSKGGPWANDLRVLNLVRGGQNTQSVSFSNPRGTNQRNFANRGRKGKTLKLMPFDQFMREDSLSVMESRNKTQQWYLQAYAMVRFLLNPAGGTSPSNRMQFEQFTRLIAQGEQARDPVTGFAVKDAKGRPVYQLYSAEKALNKTYRYSDISAFEDAFWQWMKSVH